MTFSSTFGRTFSPTFQPKSQAAASAANGWWNLNGTVTSCVAAYQPKGAASYAASKVNLANSGTYDATDGANTPTWDATNGWVFDGTNDYLDSGVVHASNYTVICRFVRRGDTGASTQIFFGANTVNTRFYLGYARSSYNYDVLNGWGTTATDTTLYSKPINIDSGYVVGLASNKGYIDGSNFADVSGSYTDTNTKTDYIGGYNNNGTAALFSKLDIYALAIYNATLTTQNMADLTTAMNLL